jgi:hypothetical protein
LGCAMHALECADRVIERENNVIVVDFQRPDPPAPHFPGAGALRAQYSEAESVRHENYPGSRPVLAS